MEWLFAIPVGVIGMILFVDVYLLAALAVHATCMEDE
jgi:hypothetical protein